MSLPNVPDLPEPQTLALTTAPAVLRARFASLFALDAELGRALAQAREPLLAQVRLAWWREELTKSGVSARDPVLVAVHRAWGAEASRLGGMIDGWEQLVGGEACGKDRFESFAAGRASGFAALASLAGRADPDAVSAEASIWALVDLARHCSSPEDAETALALARKRAVVRRKLPRSMRPVGMLAGLARRSLDHGGPLLGDRLSPFAALRIAVIGR